MLTKSGTATISTFWYLTFFLKQTDKYNNEKVLGWAWTPVCWLFLFTKGYYCHREYLAKTLRSLPIKKGKKKVTCLMIFFKFMAAHYKIMITCDSRS